MQVLFCQAPFTHVCVSMPQLPQATEFVWLGAHCLHAPVLHTSPEPQPVPSGRLLHAVVVVPGWHVWHALAGFAVPDE